MIEWNEDVEHVRRAILKAHAAVVRSGYARSSRARLKNMRQACGELNTALEVLQPAPGDRPPQIMGGSTMSVNRRRPKGYRKSWDQSRLTDDPEATLDLILIAGTEERVGEYVDLDRWREVVKGWTPEQRREVEDYSAAVHLAASDNYGVKVPPRPAVLDSLRKPS